MGFNLCHIDFLALSYKLLKFTEANNPALVYSDFIVTGSLILKFQKIVLKWPPMWLAQSHLLLCISLFL